MGAQRRCPLAATEAECCPRWPPPCRPPSILMSTPVPAAEATGDVGERGLSSLRAEGKLSRSLGAAQAGADRALRAAGTRRGPDSSWNHPEPSSAERPPPTEPGFGGALSCDLNHTLCGTAMGPWANTVASLSLSVPTCDVGEAD